MVDNKEKKTGLDILPKKLDSKKGEVDIKEAINNDLIGIYFSAHWCPPCRRFTPMLATCYEEWKKDEKIIEIIFASFDRSDDEFTQYYKEMPWLAIPRSESSSIAELKKLYGANSIPRLIILDKTGKIIDSSAQETVYNENEDAILKWTKKEVL